MKYDIQPEVLEIAEAVMREHGIEDFGPFVRFSADGVVVDGELSVPELRCLLDIAEQIVAPRTTGRYRGGETPETTQMSADRA